MSTICFNSKIIHANFGAIVDFLNNIDLIDPSKHTATDDLRGMCNKDFWKNVIVITLSNDNQ